MSANNAKVQAVIEATFIQAINKLAGKRSWQLLQRFIRTGGC